MYSDEPNPFLTGVKSHRCDLDYNKTNGGIILKLVQYD